MSTLYFPTPSSIPQHMSPNFIPLVKNNLPIPVNALPMCTDVKSLTSGQATK